MMEIMGDRVPSIEECYELMEKHSMLPNIVNHSKQVMWVSLAIVDNLTSSVAVNRERVVAAALLHDITKTRSLSTRERHDVSGAELLRDLGFTCIAKIVEQHVNLRKLDLQGRLEEHEIVYYADKRVMHDKIVTVEERIHDLIQRYGATKEIRNWISQSQNTILIVENKIASFMATDINFTIEKIATG